MSDQNPTVEQRLAALEAEVKKLRTHQVITKELQLVDDDGRLVGIIAATDSGPVIQLFDNSGETRAKFTVENGLPSLTLADEGGNTRAWLGFAKDALRIGFADEQGNNRAFFGVMNNSGPVVRFYDQSQNLVWSAPGDDE